MGRGFKFFVVLKSDFCELPVIILSGNKVLPITKMVQTVRERRLVDFNSMKNAEKCFFGNLEVKLDKSLLNLDLNMQ